MTDLELADFERDIANQNAYRKWLADRLPHGYSKILKKSCTELSSYLIITKNKTEISFNKAEAIDSDWVHIIDPVTILGSFKNGFDLKISEILIISEN